MMINSYYRKKALITSISVFLLVLIFLVLLRFIPYSSLSDFISHPYSTVYYDREGKVLQITSLADGVRREFTPLDEIPPDLVTAFITAEDKRFYFHHGVDYFSATRALFQNIIGKRRVSGASTITMQLARLINPSPRRTWTAKIKDIAVAYLLEIRLTKKDILELYLNNLPFGYNVEGLTSASRFYYGTELMALTKGQMCCLSVIPRRPASYNPFDNPENCAEAAFQIYTTAFKKSLPKTEIALSSDSSNELKEYLLKSAQESKRYEWPFLMPHFIRFVEKKIKPGTNKVTLTARSNLQKFVEFKINEALKSSSSSRIQNAAILVIDNKTADILSWAGSNDWFDEEHGGQIDGVLVPNQPGSSMKPFLYALALEPKNSDGEPLFTPAQVLPDIPMEFGSSNLYIPLNFNNRFNGPVLFRTSLASSLNVPAVYILSKIGVDNYLEFLLNAGFESLRVDGKKADLGLALGAGEVSLAELVTAFSIFPRDGQYIPLNFLSGQNTSPKSKKIIQTDTARIICNMLSDKAARVKGFGYSQVFETEYPSIFKTGTANQYQNIVALGATTEYTVGVWMGNFSGNTVVGKTGSSLPASIAKDILDFLTGSEVQEFSEPVNWKKIPVCSVSGMCIGPDCSSSVYEYVPSYFYPTQSDMCTWHKKDGKGKQTVVYPAEYQMWFNEGNKKGILDYSTAPLKIATPVDGSLFYFDPSKKQNQRIQVEVIGGSTADEDGLLSVFYDGKKLTKNGSIIEIERPFSFYLPVEKGFHTLKVVYGNEDQTISFEVR